jgi:hypothetical protein
VNILSSNALYGRDRKRLRALKRVAKASASHEASSEIRMQGQAIALALLDRSIKFTHRRLALRRLREAAELGASISSDQWIYCQNIAIASEDSLLKAEFFYAVKLARLVDAQVRTIDGFK